MDAIAAARELAASARRVEVFTGAGMSAESGIVTYRDENTGVWENVDPQDLASIDAWAKDPLTMWQWYFHRRQVAESVQPNAGHRAIATWPADVSVTTQNIDNLHERAGSKNVVHLHGSLFEYRCCMCSRPWRGEVHYDAPPECPLCHNLVRPGVVWFGEPLPNREWDTAMRRMQEADLVVIIGTSGVVQPAAGLPVIAAELGTPIIEISPQPTELTRLATVWVEGRATCLADIIPAPASD
ncbi:MAG: NAD-dependent deacylase [Corynebacterium sp.]|nr:NAD-dependent deacylase [Corynebacterium sp.]